MKTVNTAKNTTANTCTVWTPIKTQLPSKSGRYLATLQNPCSTVDFRWVEVSYFDKETRVWSTFRATDNMARYVLAWMPLPDEYVDDTTDKPMQCANVMTFGEEKIALNTIRDKVRHSKIYFHNNNATTDPVCEKSGQVSLLPIDKSDVEKKKSKPNMIQRHDKKHWDEDMEIMRSLSDIDSNIEWIEEKRKALIDGSDYDKNIGKSLVRLGVKFIHRAPFVVNGKIKFLLYYLPGDAIAIDIDFGENDTFGVNKSEELVKFAKGGNIELIMLPFSLVKNGVNAISKELSKSQLV